MSVLNFKNICVATDGTAESMKAAKLAINLAKLNSAILHIIYVIDDKVIDKISIMSVKTAEEVKEEYSETGRSNLQFIKNLANKDGVEAEFLLDEGYPSERIIEFTKKTKADLLVIGHHIRKKARTVAIGGRTTRLIELSNCAILIVK